MVIYERSQTMTKIEDYDWIRVDKYNQYAVRGAS